jgi:hypothetical protein
MIARKDGVSSILLPLRGDTVLWTASKPFYRDGSLRCMCDECKLSLLGLVNQSVCECSLRVSYRLSLEFHF